MRFLCLVIVDDDLAASMQADDWARITEESQAYDRQLMADGVFVSAEPLEHSSAARTVRVRRGEATVTDGPFVESKEAVGGFILVDVPDIAEAVAIAKGIPMARLGAIEVRPVMTFN